VTASEAWQVGYVANVLGVRDVMNVMGERQGVDVVHRANKIQGHVCDLIQ